MFLNLYLLLLRPQQNRILALLEVLLVIWKSKMQCIIFAFIFSGGFECNFFAMNVAYMTLQFIPVKHEIADAAGNPLISFE